MPLPSECCLWCKFWGGLSASDRVEIEDDPYKYDCRKRAPVAAQPGNHAAIWPMTYKHDWCGDFERV